MKEQRNQSAKKDMALVKPQINVTFEFCMGINSSLAAVFEMVGTCRQIMMYVELKLTLHQLKKQMYVSKCSQLVEIRGLQVARKNTSPKQLRTKIFPIYIKFLNSYFRFFVIFLFILI